ncbi:hypothetical protein [Sinomonas sp. P47F7]|uniref:hypothetical protein n=1 Tax=Sinomonas sp. P47F7 TaxID=3410987 RepID=UPI003BF49191
MRSVTLGHLVADESQVTDIGWRLFIDGEEITIDQEHPSWNYYQHLFVSCSVKLDLAKLRHELHLDPEVTLAWRLSARSSGCPLILAGRAFPVDDGNQDVHLEVPGDAVRGTVKLELALVVDHGVVTPGHPFAPHRPGHLIFTTEHLIRLEEEGNQVPILPVSFREQGVKGSSGALWWLNVINRDLEAPVNSALWLWLNTDNPRIQSLLRSPDEEVNLSWTDFLGIDFSRQLLREAMQAEDLSLEISYPEGSLGETLSSIVRLLSDSTEKLRAAYREDAGRVEAELQSLTSERPKNG